jgi:multidrug efflux system membrane fusion protein
VVRQRSKPLLNDEKPIFPSAITRSINMKFLRLLIPLVVVGGCASFAYFMMVTKPEPRTRPSFTVPTYIKATRLKLEDYPVIIRSQGTVRARTRSTLIPEVSGRILSVSPAFRDGGFFEKGDLLLEIDPSDYAAAVVVSEATLAQAVSALAQEKAQSKQAQENWDKLGKGDANPLVLREPQLAEAQARVDSAQARLDQSEREWERTKITAPYAGRILQQQVDIGQVVGLNTTLASIFAVDYVEIRLPLSNEHLDHIKLPEAYRGEGANAAPLGPKVKLSGTYGSRTIVWDGQIVRADGALDLRSRQLFVVAQVDNPYGRSDSDKPPLKVGQFVQAEIDGITLENVFVVPRSVVRGGNEVLIVDGQSKLERRIIEPLWSDRANVVTRVGLNEGEVICLTALAFVANGASVLAEIDGVPPAGGGGKGKGEGKGPGVRQRGQGGARPGMRGDGRGPRTGEGRPGQREQGVESRTDNQSETNSTSPQKPL